jgi:hypothetical protein
MISASEWNTNSSKESKNFWYHSCYSGEVSTLSLNYKTYSDRAYIVTGNNGVQFSVNFPLKDLRAAADNIVHGKTWPSYIVGSRYHVLCMFLPGRYLHHIRFGVYMESGIPAPMSIADTPSSLHPRPT